MIAPHDLVVEPDEAALSVALAELFVRSAAEAIRSRGVFDVSLAGGSTPKAAYALLAGRFAREVEWPRVRFFFGDERCVGPEDDESNYHTADVALFRPLGIAPETIERMRGEDEPAAAAAAYAGMLRARFGPDPCFDLVMLGMGPDGHTASLFPGSDPYADDAALVRAPYVEKMSGHRLTLTPHAINGARRIVVATAGTPKAEALAAVLAGNATPLDHPIVVLAPRDGRLTFLVDRAATARLPAT